MAYAEPAENWGTAVPIPRAGPPAEAARRLKRLRSLSWFLDRSIPVGKWRIGFDPIIGLIPGAGDWIGALLSLYVMYEGARLGVPAGVVTRMGGNILIETIFGAVPILGDVFDFAWQANTRNLALIEQYYQPALPARSLRKIWAVLLAFGVLIFGILGALIYATVQLLQAAF